MIYLIINATAPLIFIENFDETPYEIKKPSGQDRIAAENPTK